MARPISTSEVAKHNTPDDLWLVVDDTVYDMTEYAKEHPGGADGRDASKAYNEIHAPSLIKKTLASAKILGILDLSTITSEWTTSPSNVEASTKSSRPPLESLINTYDFVEAAEQSITPKTWAFYSSAATDLITKSRNNSAYGDIGLRPRILVNVKDINTKRTMLGVNMDLPIFCSPAAMAKMIHPEGEKGIAKGCRKMGIPQCVSTSASFPVSEILESVSEEGEYGSFGPGTTPLFFQLYVDKNREKSEKLLKEVERLGVKAIFVTVDAPVAGKREADERVKADENMAAAPMSGAKAKNDSKGGALGRLMASFIDSSLCWSDIEWLRRCTTLPIVLKGVQTAMDALKAAEMGIDGILLSNHGGRSLDTSPAPVLILLELQKNCPEVFGRMEIFVDGGIMRGTDVFKALCLGARSVGIGRGFLYALNYGSEGVEKFVDIIKDEFETTMRMMGVTDLSQLHAGMLNTGAVDHLIPCGDEHPYAKWRPRSKI